MRMASVIGAADEHVGDVFPHAEFDFFAVDEDELAVGTQRGGGDDVIQQHHSCRRRVRRLRAGCGAAG